MTKSQAVSWAGSMSELARRLKVTRQAVQRWPAKAIPKRREYEIRALQEGRVP